MDESLQILCDTLGHNFNSPEILLQALTHPSISAAKSLTSYERLEFLGDRVLGLVMAEYVFKKFPKESEGVLSRRHANLVRRETLVKVAQAIHLNRYVHLTPAEQRTGGRKKPSVLANCCEAIIGALYIDAGLEIASHFIIKYWTPLIEDSDTSLKDAKSILQEWAQGQGKPIPTYTVLEVAGTDHNPCFTIQVKVKDSKPAQGQGASKREATQAAAKALLTKLAIEPK